MDQDYTPSPGRTMSPQKLLPRISGYRRRLFLGGLSVIWVIGNDGCLSYYICKANSPYFCLGFGERMKNLKTIGLCAFLVAGFLFVPQASIAVSDVPKYEIFELTLTSAKSYSNPFTDVEVKAVFTTPLGTKLTAYGFYDDANIWRIRVAPEIAGTWSYSVTASDVANTGLHNKNGSFTVSASSKKGFIRPDPNHKNYFAFSDGSPFFPMVDASFWMPVGISDAQRVTYFDTRKSQLFNTVWFTIQPSVDHTHSTIAPADAWAWGGTSSAPDYSRLNVQYFRRLERIIGELRDREMYAVIVMTNFYSPKMATEVSISGHDAWIRYAVARLAAYTTVFRWDAAFEYILRPDGVYRYDVPADDDWLRSASQLIRVRDPQRHPISSCMTDGEVTHLQLQQGIQGQKFGDFPQIDVLTFQHRPDATSTWNGQAMVGSAAGLEKSQSSHRIWNKPVMGTESGFEYLPNFFTLNHQVFDTNTVRRAAWRSFTGGAAGYSNGFIGTAFGQDGYKDPWNNSIVVPFKIADAGWAAQARHYYTFITTKTGFRDMNPAQSLVNSPNICLANPGQEYVVYAPSGGSITLDLASGTFNLEWFNPRTGVHEGQTTISGGASRTFSSPDTNDWVLHLKKSSVTPTLTPLPPTDLHVL